MMRESKREWFRLFHSPVRLIFLLLALLLPIAAVIGRSTSSSELQAAYERVLGNEERKVERTLRYYGAYIYGADTPEEEMADSIEQMKLDLRARLYDNMTTQAPELLLATLVLPFLLLGHDFHTGAIAAPLRLGRRRAPLAAAKLQLCLILMFLLALLCGAFPILTYRAQPLGGISPALLLRNLLLRALLETASLSLPVMLVFWLPRRIFVFVECAACVALQLLLRTLSLPLPSCCLANSALWAPGASASSLLLALASALVTLALTSALAIVRFRKMPLR